jgi:DNA damage-binding protein 1
LEFIQQAIHYGHLLAIHISSNFNEIIVGDLMKSISVLVYDPIANTLNERYRDYETNWMTSCEFINDCYIGSCNSQNLFILKNNEKRLQSVAQIHTCQTINKIKRRNFIF